MRVHSLRSHGLVVLVSFSILSLNRPAWPEEPIELDLPRAIDYARQQNRDLARAALSIARDEWGVRSSRAAFALRARPDSNLGFSSERDSWQYGLEVGKLLPWGTSVDLGSRVTRTLPEDQDDIQRTTLQVELRQPLFRGFGRLVNQEGLAQAGSRLKTTQRNYQQQQADLVVNVVEHFEMLLQLEAQITSDTALFARMDRLYRLTNARMRQGRATRVDSLRVELQRGQARARLEELHARLSATRRDFAELLGFPPEQAFTLTPPPLLDLQVPSLEEAVGIALANRLDYAEQQQAYADEQRGEKIARRQLLPDLSLVTRYERFGEGADFAASSELDEDAWFVGLVADTDFNLRRERAALEQARIDVTEARDVIHIQELIIAREVQQHITAFRSARAQLDIAENNIVLARKRAQLAERLFRAGRGDPFSASDAEDAFREAEREMLASRAAASISGYQLLRTLGTLIDYPESLKPAVQEASL